MGKVTSKLQVTVPKAVAEQFGIQPGDEIEWQPAGDFIRVFPTTSPRKRDKDLKERLRRFDEAVERQRRRERRGPRPAGTGRGWTREELYRRGQPG